MQVAGIVSAIVMDQSRENHTGKNPVISVFY